MKYCRLLLAFAGALPMAAQTAQNPLPNAALADPAGQVVLFTLKTLPHSVQIYTCKPNPAGDQFVWTGPDPDAVMTNYEKTMVVHHYKGPSWEETDGSLVQSSGAEAKHFLAKSNDAVHWLELPAKQPTLRFAKVTFIHRIDTAGGLAPEKPCDSHRSGEQERVSYSATYVFYAPK